MSSVPLILLWLHAIFSYGSSEYVNRHHWSKETNNSLRLNVKGCRIKYSPGLSMPEDSKTFLVSTFLPTKSELKAFENLPATLTKANAKVQEVNFQHQYDWSKGTESLWYVPTDHVAQNRSNCYKLTELAAKEGVLDLFQNFKEVHRTFYLLRNRHAVIHPSGSVMVGCGYYQGENCLIYVDMKIEQYCGDQANNKLYKLKFVECVSINSSIAVLYSFYTI